MLRQGVLPPPQPRGLNVEQASAYIGVSQSYFRTLVEEGQMPQPKRLGSRTLWDRLALDAAFEAIGQEPDTNPWELP